MNSKTIFEAISYVDDRYLEMVDTPEMEKRTMKQRTFTRKTLTVLIAAAICASLLTVTAMAAGWIPKIFASVTNVFPEDAEVLEDAVDAALEQTIETVTVPEVDFTQFTLYERYYDGESILLGYDLTKVIPETIVGFRPDSELLSKIKNIAKYEETPIYGQTCDDLEEYVSLGVMSQEEYETVLNDRTEYGKKHDLKKYQQILMDLDMKHTLTEEQYEQFWAILSETGSCCVAIPSQPWIADHVYVNDTDCGVVLGPGCGTFRTDYSTEEGECMVLHPLPDVAKHQHSVSVKLNLRSGWNYWYMELEGDVYHHFESNEPYPAVFTIENVNN